MALEDLAMFRVIPNMTVLYPSDAVSMEHAVFLAANTQGMCYIRGTRNKTRVIYDKKDCFSIGKSKVISYFFEKLHVTSDLFTHIVSTEKMRKNKRDRKDMRGTKYTYY